MSLLPAVMPERAVALTVAVGWALVWFLGHGLLIGLVVAALLRTLRRRSADVRYGVACAGLLVMVFCPVGTTLRFLAAAPSPAVTAMASVRPGAVPASDRGTPRDDTVDSGVHEPSRMPAPAGGKSSIGVGIGAASSGPIPATTRSPRWAERIEARLPAVVAAWLIGVIVMALRLTKGLIDVRGLIRREILPPTEELQALIGRLVERSGLRRPVSWFLSLRVEVPTVVGWLRPTVLIPARGMAQLTIRQLEALLAHEIAHIRRHDYLVNMCQVTIEAALFFHPAVWWVSRRIRAERENCCDDSAVALCGGDRLLVARALFALEEQRAEPVLRVAATGASLKERVRRLVLPDLADPCPAESGWAGGGLIAGVFGLVAAAWLAGPTQARDEVAPKPAQSTVRGRVLDDAGRPIAGARVRLYHRDSSWEHRNPVLEEAKAGPDGGFQLSTPLKPRPPSEKRGPSPYVLLADLPGKAVGWRIVPINVPAFEGDLTLRSPVERTFTVIDAKRQPVPGAMVVAYGLGDEASALPDFRDHLLLRPEDGPLTAITGADGRATLAQLPKTRALFVATKSGFAETNAFNEQDVIRLTPAATLSGRVTGPDGEPLSGVKVVLYTAFMWHFERTMTDAEGRYHFNDLRARGWDMSAWSPNKEADGRYKIWLDDDRYAMHTGSLTLEPNASQTLDIKAMNAGVIRVTLVEEGTDKPVVGARIWGFDAETGSSARFSAHTDAQGRATFYSAPSKISLSLVGPPDGVYYEGDRRNTRGAHKTFEFSGGESDVTLVMPPIAGTLIAVSGVCTLPDGSPAGDASVNARAGLFVTSGTTNLIRNRRTDGAGRFTLEWVPSGRILCLYAETADRRFAGTTTFSTPEKSDPAFRIAFPLSPTVAVEKVIEDDEGKPLNSRKFHLSPRVGEDDFSAIRRTVESDAQGRVKFDGIVPGLSYRIHEDVPPREGPIIVPQGGRRPWYEEVIVLAPEKKR